MKKFCVKFFDSPEKDHVISSHIIFDSDELAIEEHINYLFQYERDLQRMFPIDDTRDFYMSHCFITPYFQIIKSF